MSSKEHIHKELAYVEGQLLENYLYDVKICQKFAVANRRAMADEIMYRMDIHKVDAFEIIHNYIDVEYGILRKGAVSAQIGEKLLIPINMRDGSLICIGKGNPDWNYSAPHGAGKLMSRTQARKDLDIDTFKIEMSGIYTTSIEASILGESPMAYKSMSDIVGNIGDTCEIVSIIKPAYNYKAH